MEDTVFFFGYGSLKSAARIKEIIGRDPGKGQGAYVQGYTLAIQVIDQLPESIRDTLRNIWGDSFRAYTLRKGSGNVYGIVWELSRGELEKIKRWELDGSWRVQEEISVHTGGGMTISAVTERVPDNQPVKEIVDGLNYEIDLNPFGEAKRKQETIRQEDDEQLERWRRVLRDLKPADVAPAYAQR